jgi:DNA-binding beta-propeller fold protein YncE
MAMGLTRLGTVRLPQHAAGGFDHGDVHRPSGRVFVAHTANGTVDVIDGGRCELVQTIGGCAEGSGVLCAQADEDLVFAAARGAGKVLVIDPVSFAIRNEIQVGPKPNGLAWDSGRRQLLVADVEDYRARLLTRRRVRSSRAHAFQGGREPDAIWFNARLQVVYVAIGDPGLIDIVDARHMVVSQRLTTEQGAHTTAFDAERQRLYVFLPRTCQAAVYATRDNG